MFTDQRNDVKKERVKLTANTVNALGIAVMVLGLIRPMLTDGNLVIADSIASFIIGAILHATALRTLSRMPEED